MENEDSSVLPETENQGGFKTELEKVKRVKILRSPILYAGILLIICAALGSVYLQKHNDIDDLESKVEISQATLQGVSSEAESINETKLEKESELDAIEEELTRLLNENKEALAFLSSPEHSLDIYDEIVYFGSVTYLGYTDESAEDGEITTIKGASGIEEGGNGDEVLPYSVVMDGSEDALLDFVSDLIDSNELLRGMELSSISLKRGCSASVDGSYVPYTLDLNLEVQTWPEAN